MATHFLASSEVTPAAAAGVDEGLAEFCYAVERAAIVAGLSSTEALLRSVRSAWAAGQVAQRAEISRLKRTLGQAVELERAAQEAEDAGPRSFGDSMSETALRLEESERSRKDQIDAQLLWTMAENRTSGSTVERRARARALTRATFKYLASTMVVEEEEVEAGDDAKVAVPGEGLISVDGSRQRLRLLERHEAAGRVEYRFFGAALSDEDGFEEAAGTTTLLYEQAAQSNSTAFLSAWFSGCFAGADSMDTEEFEKKYGEDLAELKLELAEGAGDGTLSRWLEPLAELLGSSTTIRLDPDNFINVEEAARRVSLFPLFLAFLSSRQGNLELLAVYYLMRILGRQNAQALARFEGRSVPASLDAFVAKQEAMLLRQEQEDLFATVGFSFVFGYAISFALAAVVIWQLVNALFGFFEPVPPDPLAF